MPANRRVRSAPASRAAHRSGGSVAVSSSTRSGEISKSVPPVQPSSFSAYRRTSSMPPRSMVDSISETVAMTFGSDWAATS